MLVLTVCLFKQILIYVTAHIKDYQSLTERSNPKFCNRIIKSQYIMHKIVSKELFNLKYLKLRTVNISFTKVAAKESNTVSFQFINGMSLFKLRNISRLCFPHYILKFKQRKLDRVYVIFYFPLGFYEHRDTDRKKPLIAFVTYSKFQSGFDN